MAAGAVDSVVIQDGTIKEVDLSTEYLDSELAKVNAIYSAIWVVSVIY